MNFPDQGIIELFKKTEGAISLHEGCAIYWLAGQCPEGCAVELGSHEGKAAIMAAAGFAKKALLGSAKDFHLVDPCYDTKNAEAWANSVQGTSENAWHKIHDPDFNDGVRNRIFNASVFRVTKLDNEHDQVDAKVRPVLHGDYSLHAIPEILAPFSYCMVDSDVHTYELTRDENALLKERMAIGGIIAYHDFQSQFLGVERAYREMLQGGMYEEIGIPWGEIKDFVKSIGGEDGQGMPCCSWHHREMEAPCFLGALRRVK